MKNLNILLTVCTDSPEKLTVTGLERFFEECLNAGVTLKRGKKFIESLENLNEYTKESIERTYQMFLEDEEEQPEQKEEEIPENIFEEQDNNIKIKETELKLYGLAEDLTVIPVKDQYRVVGNKIDARVKENYMLYDVTGKGARKYKQDIIQAVSYYIHKKSAI